MKKQLLTLITLFTAVIGYSQTFQDGNDIIYQIISTSANTVKTIDYAASQTSISIPASVTYNNETYSVIEIGESSFENLGLLNVVIPNSVTIIGEKAFDQNQLSNVFIPSSVVSIGASAFENNVLSSVIIPNGVSVINNNTFRNNQLTSVTIPDGVTIIGNNAFSINLLPSVTIPNTVTTIGLYAFQGNELTSLIVPNSVTSIGVLAFDSNLLASVTLSNSMTAILPQTFANNLLTTITIPDTVTIIGHYAFRDNQLTSVTIPSNVTNIGFSVFNNNPLLVEVISLATTPPTITTGGSNDSFSSDRSNINLILTGNTTDEYVTDNGALWTGFKMVFEATSATTLKVSDYEVANGTAVSIPASITIPSVTTFNVTEIGNSAFFNKGITSVTIPDSVTNIGSSAFEFNNLTDVTIPNNVTVIQTAAFANNAIANLSLGDNVEIIGIGAFVVNNLTDITIPSNVTNIDLLAFGNNPGLVSVTSLATVPPIITTGTNDTFIFDRSNTALHIPAGTMGAYVTDPGALWTGFNPVTEDALSVSDFELENSIKVITTTDGLKIEFSNNLRLENYTIYSLSGAKVSTGTESEISTSFLASGIYVLKLDFDKGMITKKVVIN